ncbi:hypothetical protein Glove_29g31 [Diversispora epigaea]|uniref:Uncharacterized protein n=1 Tax=Diversispora epigaea TaxID=1348612 RepID=A0A397JSG9_9GLOM|nr:hypothetical protein Glove_29g31 [Diversispora epigaea]
MGQWRLELIAIKTFTRCCPAGAKVSVYQNEKNGELDFVESIIVLNNDELFKHSGIGAAIVVMPLVTELKRNTLAFERAVEYTCPGLKYLSCDARLSKVDSLVALYPSPDDVVPAKNVEGKKLDAEEDFILAALVLEQGLKKGYRPSIGGKSRVVYQLCEITSTWPSEIRLVKTETLETGWVKVLYIGNLASTATVAASSFEMKIKDPRELIDLIDPEKYKEFLEQWFRSSTTGSITGKVQVLEDNVVTDVGCIV